MAGCAPVFLECGTLLGQQFALGGVVHHNEATRRVDAIDYNIVQRGLALGAQGDDERAAFLELGFEVAPLAVDCEDLVAMLVEIRLHVRSADPVSSGDIEALLDGFDGAVGRCVLALLMGPVPHEHGERRGSAAVAWLRDEGDVDPDCLLGLRGEHDGGEGQQADKERSTHSLVIHGNQNDDHDDEDDEQQRGCAEEACGEIVLRVIGAG